ncbi:MAG: hypothetical protein HN732_21025 [Rhodospirillaceae bacterium]|nr:hypothetical protein [Rhodospirillaceae bacterium]
MRHVFGNNFSSQEYDWKDAPFDTDYLMQASNRHATITADDEYEDYINPDTRRRDKTQAPQLFKILDNHKALYGRSMDNERELVQLAMDHGTSPDVATKYNAGNQTDKDMINQGVGAGLEWAATATPAQLAMQRKAAEKANAYKLAGKAPTLGVDYTDFSGLSAFEADRFFNGTPETRKTIADKLNADMQPWQAPLAVDSGAGSTKSIAQSKYAGMASQSPDEIASINISDSGKEGSISLQSKSEEEQAEVQELARTLTIKLQGDPEDVNGPPPEYRKVAFLPALLAAGALSPEALATALTAVVGAKIAGDILRGLFGKTGQDELQPKANSSGPRRKGPMPNPPGMNKDQSQKYYQTLGDDLIELWTEPLESRGNATTKRGNDIVAKECQEVLEKEFPELLGKIDHIGGANFRGDGESKLKEWTLLHKQTGMKNRSRADLTWGQIDEHGKALKRGEVARAHLNTQDMLKSGEATAWEAFSLARLVGNAGGELVEAIRKLKKDDDEVRYRRDVREKCRVIMAGLKKQLEELEENQDNPNNNENEHDDAQSSGDGNE